MEHFSNVLVVALSVLRFVLPVVSGLACLSMVLAAVGGFFFWRRLVRTHLGGSTFSHFLCGFRTYGVIFSAVSGFAVLVCNPALFIIGALAGTLGVIFTTADRYSHTLFEAKWLIPACVAVGSLAAVSSLPPGYGTAIPLGVAVLPSLAAFAYGATRYFEHKCWQEVFYG
jgi:hypothetical protein